MLKADMHIHSTSSDGIFTPQEIINWALRKNIGAISITDHDTINGFFKALEYITENDVNIVLVPGVELSCMYSNYEVHLLGYCFDYKSSYLKNVLDDIRFKRINRAKEMIDKLNNLDIDISLEDIKMKCNEDTSIGRPHIARELRDRGYVKDTDDAFNKYLNEGKCAFVPRYKLSLKEGIDLIHNDGGVAVLAHPGLLKINYVNLIDKYDFDGIEIYHPKNDKYTRNELLHIAKRKKMLITGGSDFHDMYVNDIPMIGDYNVDIESKCRIENNVCVAIKK